uniref:Predicted protein n=1 Tax=Physcomitrium patens TaxID=3218 RepID=A9U4Q2_PHYPA
MVASLSAHPNISRTGQTVNSAILLEILRPLTKREGGIEVFGTPLDNFPVRGTAETSNRGSADWHELVANKGNYIVFQNPTFSPASQPIKLFARNNNKARTAESSVIRAVLPSSSQPYVPYSAYQKSIPTKELTNELVSRDPNESLLLTLTKKMDELAVNLAKDKEKRHKPTNMRPNVWYSNCKGQGHLMQTSQPAEDKGPVQRDSSVHRVEVVKAVLIKDQQKGKNPIQDLDDPMEVTTVAPSKRRTEPISVLGRIPILSPQ